MFAIFREISSGRDLKKFLGVILTVYILLSSKVKTFLIFYAGERTVSLKIWFLKEERRKTTNFLASGAHDPLEPRSSVVKLDYNFSW